MRQPDPLADAAAGIIQHMNADHADALILLARVFAGIESQEAAMTSVDRLGFHVRLKTQGRHARRPHRILAGSEQSGGSQKSSGGNGGAGAAKLSERVFFQRSSGPGSDSRLRRFTMGLGENRQ